MKETGETETADDQVDWYREKSRMDWRMQKFHEKTAQKDDRSLIQRCLQKMKGKAAVCITIVVCLLFVGVFCLCFLKFSFKVSGKVFFFVLLVVCVLLSLFLQKRRHRRGENSSDGGEEEKAQKQKGARWRVLTGATSGDSQGHSGRSSRGSHRDTSGEALV
uniref:Uncharacterized protein n=1 Tax=Chromera velia CCMP2878 TaxID=1169474 RepID=A0A0G4FIC4_9ALVE|mmetsp:Transcript_5776/g.11448  ORF Transcript_5776/g.11448 Transcript_5776/m.11448 type:complete len:162 (-) Transcript_5776:91-576(-)|eukprot:Cvel_17149.t1-p1 / transcript=Cvel_17149.t1 / gene=Cvel_17149 / organism=Chromera_velia_CCMP2878 / gene_product=hypothetical protein / transcript_product=hypothetical protein / location=Cvel_scaffold1354:43900-44382(-) / protein_length=161 / sequence_SO=supercontig / SO=protein_coding / is_pseudo=false